MTITAEALRIAPIDMSTSRCYGCSEYLTKIEQDNLYDHYGIEHSCGDTLTDILDAWVDLHPQSAPFLDDEIVLSSTWYHFTTSQDWALDLHDDLLVHVGTQDSAMARQRANGGDTLGGFLHTVRLRPGTIVGQEMIGDMLNAWPSRVSQCGQAQDRDFSRFVLGANRYINIIEAPGQISLLVPARDLILQTVTEVLPTRAWE